MVIEVFVQVQVGGAVLPHQALLSFLVILAAPAAAQLEQTSTLVRIPEPLCNLIVGGGAGTA